MFVEKRGCLQYWDMCLDLNVFIALCIETKVNGKFQDETLTDFLLLLQHSIKGQI